jgi:hypothetical protein
MWWQRDVVPFDGKETAVRLDDAFCPHIALDVFVAGAGLAVRSRKHGVETRWYLYNRIKHKFLLTSYIDRRSALQAARDRAEKRPSSG